ncbi:hypothetical protein [Curtobacterium flaccumfaciens]|uniref:hypothetical protein n=1 Tax=Curtobacterium flaccumfaciens TaxID=2035 RepID=UPI00105BBE24|nr:hypothetical protein [Curtobacterium flaccumfaciens]
MSVAVAATIALGATGCEFMSPAQTTEIKQITDGVDVSTGKIDVRNALLISDDGEQARFIGTLVNNAEKDDITVSIEIGGDTQTVEVPANTHVDLAMTTDTTAEGATEDTGSTTQGTEAGAGTDVIFDNADAKPGSLVKVYFSYSGAEGVSASVPVLTSSQEEYQTLAPTPTPTSTSTSPSESGSEPTGDATDTPINP